MILSIAFQMMALGCQPGLHRSALFMIIAADSRARCRQVKLLWHNLIIASVIAIVNLAYS